MSKNEDFLFQSQSIKPNSTIIWNNNNINGNININNNYSSNINPIKRSGSITFKNSAYNKDVMSSPIITLNSSNYKKIKLANGSKSKTKIKNLSNNHYGTKTEGDQLEMNHAKNYINYLHEHLDTSFNANNELNNKTEMIINMTKDIESEIKKNNEIYKNLILSYNDKLKANNKYKNEFINFLNQYKKHYKSISSDLDNNKKEFDELNQKNLSLKKEIKDTTDIISYLKKTEDILQNNALTKYKKDCLNYEKEKNLKKENEIRILNKELNKLMEIKNLGNKNLENLSKRNTKLKEEINKLEKQLKKNKKNNSEDQNLINDKKIRNKKFILDNNKKYKINNNDYYKQLINAENNKAKDLINQIYSILKLKVEEKEKEKQKEKEVIKRQKLLKDKPISQIENNINGKKQMKKKVIEIKIEDNDTEEDEEEEDEIEEKVIITKKNKKQTEEKFNSTFGTKSFSKINQNTVKSQTFYRVNPKLISKKENKSESENENDETEKEKEFETEIEKEEDFEVEKNQRKKHEKNKKKEKKEEIEKQEKKEKKNKKEKEEEEIEIEEKAKAKKTSRRKSKEDSNINKEKEKDKNKTLKQKEKSSEKSKLKEKEKEKLPTNKEKSKTKIESKEKTKSKEKSKEKLEFSKKDKEYEFSLLSDQSKKSKLFSHIAQNSISMEEISSIMNSSKTQKKLSQSQESIIDILTAPLKGSYLYTITNKGKLLSFNITHKKFAIIDSSIIDGWTSFVPNYLKNIDGSLLLNTLEGLFVITGANHNELYFYSQEKSLIAQIITFKACHKFGGLLLSPSPDNTLFAIGGENENNEVEHFSFDNDSCQSMPNLLTKRINASYTFINSKLYAIFGEGNNTIEYLNIKKLKNKWTKIDFKMDNNNLKKEKYINNIYGHVSLPVNDNDILIVGGKNNKKMMVLDLDEETLDVTDMKVPFIDVVGEYIFDKEKFFNQVANEDKKEKDDKSVKQLIGMDTAGNIHLFDYNFNYVVLLIKNHTNKSN